MKSTKIIGTFLTAATATALLTSCASGPSADGSVELTFWDGNAIPERTEVWKEIIGDFEAENPGVTIKYVGLPQDQSGTKLDNAVATNSTPDLAVIPRGDVANYQAQDALLQLDDLLADSELADALSPSQVDRVRASVPDEKLYALPTHFVPDTLWYRPQLFEAAGVEVPDTWNDFIDAAESLTDSSTGQYGYTIRGGEGAGYNLLTDLYVSSGITDFFDSSGKTTLNDPAHVEAVEQLAGLFGTSTPEADVTNTYPKMLAQFQAGNIAMMQHNIGSYPTLLQTFDETELKPLPLPRSEDDAPRIIVPGLPPSVGIMKDTEHPDESWKFLEFVLDAENNSKLAEVAAGIPSNVEAQSADWAVASPAIQSALEVLDDPTTEYVQAPSYLPEWAGIIKNEVEPEYQRVLLGETTAKEFLDMWAASVDEAQARYEERQGK